MIKLSKLVKEIILADAVYFSKNHFVPDDTLFRVKKWIGDQQDKETQLMIADWLESDAQFLDDLGQALVNYHWFILPFMSAFVCIVPKRLRKYAEELRNA